MDRLGTGTGRDSRRSFRFFEFEDSSDDENEMGVGGVQRTALPPPPPRALYRPGTLYAYCDSEGEENKENRCPPPQAVLVSPLPSDSEEDDDLFLEEDWDTMSSETLTSDELEGGSSGFWSQSSIQSSSPNAEVGTGTPSSSSAVSAPSSANEEPQQTQKVREAFSKESALLAQVRKNCSSSKF
jgi:hypothetical protein